MGELSVVGEGSESGAGRPVLLLDDGILWWINRVAFHPRGYALAVDPVTGVFYLLGDGSETFSFGPESDETAHLERIKALMP